MSESFERATVGDIVAADFRAASVFEQFGIDFCCGGRRSVAEACHAAAVDPAVLQHALDRLPAHASGDEDLTDWPADRLIDHIVDTHHAYVRASLPTLHRYFAKLVEVHGRRHPELARIASSIQHTGRDLMQHMMKEEHVLFPYIRACALSNGCAPISSPFGTVENPIRMMEREHREAADEMRVIRELTGGYTPPPDACATYRVAFEELERFDRDLHRHVHLENNVLFPRAVELERQPHRA